MGKSKNTSAVVDNFLRLLALGSVLTVGITAPNAIQMLDKPISKLFDKLDDREKTRKLKKIQTYMRTQGLVRGSYEHGIAITKKGMKRLKDKHIRNLSIPKPEKWDNKWRLVIFDIPENKRDSRRILTSTLKELGFQILQQSVWIFPYPCKEEISIVCTYYGVAEWVTYLETDHIDHSDLLKIRFKTVINL